MRWNDVRIVMWSKPPLLLGIVGDVTNAPAIYSHILRLFSFLFIRCRCCWCRCLFFLYYLPPFQFLILFCLFLLFFSFRLVLSRRSASHLNAVFTKRIYWRYRDINAWKYGGVERGALSNERYLRIIDVQQRE